MIRAQSIIAKIITNDEPKGQMMSLRRAGHVREQQSWAEAQVSGSSSFRHTAVSYPEEHARVAEAQPPGRHTSSAPLGSSNTSWQK